MDTSPVTEVPQSPEAQLEAIFARQTGEAKPEPKEEAEAPEAEADDDEPEAVSDTDTDTDEAEDGQSEEVADEVELTIGDEVKKLTKAELAEIVAKRDSFQKDYTQKTQEVAEKRKAVDDRDQYLQARELVMQHAFKEAAEVESITAQLQQFQSLDWNSLIADDPQRALQLNLARQQLQDTLQTKQKALQEVIGRTQQMQEAHKRKQVELGQAELARRLGKLDDQTRAGLMSVAKELDYSEADMMSPAALHALHLASKYLALQKSKALTEKKVAQAKPMSAPAARSGNQSIEQSKREALKTRALKTGKTADAEAYLERLFSMKRKR
jgi:hypothetical protein